MRTVILDNLPLKVSDDSDNIIRDLLEFAFSTPHIDSIESMFAPSGEGLLVPDFINCYRALEVMDFPEYM